MMPATRDAAQQTLLRAERLLIGGNPAEAAALVAPLPRDARALGIMARAARDMGNTEVALARFKDAAEAGGRDPARWREFVTELLKAGQKSRARKVAQKAPLAGTEKKALLDLARDGVKQNAAALGGVSQAEVAEVQALFRQGDVPSARSRAAALLRAHPGSAYLHNFLGIVAMVEEDAPTAESHFKEALRISPDFSGAGANLGHALTTQEKYVEAIAVLRRVVGNDPASTDARYNLASAYFIATRHNDAIDELEKVLSAKPDDPDALGLYAKALAAALRFDEALGPLRRLERMAPRNTDVQVEIFRALEGGEHTDEALAYADEKSSGNNELRRLRSVLLAQLGRVGEARADLERQIVESDDYHEAFYHYGSFGRWTADDPLLPKLEAAAASLPEDTTRHPVFFALGKARVDLGDYAGGFAAYRRANDIQSKLAKFDLDFYRREAATIMETWTAAALGRLKGVGVESQRPIFVIGMPRSGSTLTEQILAAHPEVTGIGEDSVVRGYFPVTMPADPNLLVDAARAGARAMRRISGEDTRIVDKFLHNFQRLGALAAAYPNAVFIHTERDPRSVALSMFVNPMKVAGHPYSTNLEWLGQYYLIYADLMDHWMSCLGDRILSSRYEALVADPRPGIERMLAFAGLPWDDACLRPDQVASRIKTLSIAQVRSEISTQSVEKWRKFEDELEPFSKILRDAGRL